MRAWVGSPREDLPLQAEQTQPRRSNLLSDKEGAKEGSTSSEINQDEWGEFLHKPGEKFYDFNKIRDEIVADTEAKTGK